MMTFLGRPGPWGRARLACGIALALFTSSNLLAQSTTGESARPPLVSDGASAPAAAAKPAPTETTPPPRKLELGTLPAPAANSGPNGPVPAWVTAAAGAPLAPDDHTMPINLALALRMVNATNPTIQLAQTRVLQAVAVLRQAQVLLVPNIFLGGNPLNLAFLPAFYHHDGFLQNSNGAVFFTDKNNFFLQGGATIQVSLADAGFQPFIARAAAEAARQRARAATNSIQLDVALAYLDLLRVYAELAINDEVIRKTSRLHDAAAKVVSAGLGKTGAYANQALAELEVRRQERLVLKGQAGVASARLAQLLLLDPTIDLLPMDQTVVPIALVPIGGNIDDLLATALLQRPELAESRAQLREALSKWRQAKFRPLLPTLQIYYYGGNFVGGNPDPRVSSGRNDIIGQPGWEFRNGGLGNWFQAREMRANYSASDAHVVEVQAAIGAEVSAATKIARAREQALASAQRAVFEAEELWRKLEALRFGVGGPAREYDPLQPLLAVRAVREARLLYLAQVMDYNRAQFRLYWAMGQPPEQSLPGAAAIPINTALLPGRSGTSGARPDQILPEPKPPEKK